jgi:hypothetical protein
MPSKNSFFDNLLNGISNPKGTLGDFQHAARLFVDDSFRLAPKVKFLYHVSFGINFNAAATNLKYQHQNEINMLVKAVDLPKFTINTESLNQYNRKKVIQNKIDYDPITITFHDDNMGVINQMWQNYFYYYYADPSSAASSPAQAYGRNATLSSAYNRYGFGYKGPQKPFFNKITLYQMARHEYVSYTLLNPVVKNWSHENMDSASSQANDNKMTIEYETLFYNVGRVRRGDPEGFAVDHYDLTPSPLTVAGGGTASVFGPGGVLEGAVDVFGDLYTGKTFESPLDFLNTAITAVNTYQNSKNLTREGISQEGRNILTKTVQALPGTIGGSNNIVFPVQNTASVGLTQGVLRSITGG